jgi:hypothetical protein
VKFGINSPKTARKYRKLVQEGFVVTAENMKIKKIFSACEYGKKQVDSQFALLPYFYLRTRERGVPNRAIRPF